MWRIALFIIYLFVFFHAFFLSCSVLFFILPSELFVGKKRRNIDKFPEDVRTAQLRTGGDPDITKQYEKEPEARPNIASIFGDKSAKGKKGGKNVGKNAAKTAGKSAGKNAGGERCSIPRRVSDSSDTSDETTSTNYSMPNRFALGGLVSTGSRRGSFDDKQYRCQFTMCNFSTDRLNVIVLHNKTHTNEMSPMTVNCKCIHMLSF